MKKSIRVCAAVENYTASPQMFECFITVAVTLRQARCLTVV